FAGETITIQGSRFDARDPSLNTVAFTRSAQAGGGQTFAQVTAVSPTQLTVIVPADATTGPVSVQTVLGTGTSPTAFIVKSPTPTVTSFTPTSGPVGTNVVISGSSLQVGNDPTTVTFAGNGTLRLPALVTFSSETELHATVPNGAVTGTIEI